MNLQFRITKGKYKGNYEVSVERSYRTRAYGGRKPATAYQIKAPFQNPAESLSIIVHFDDGSIYSDFHYYTAKRYNTKNFQISDVKEIKS